MASAYSDSDPEEHAGSNWRVMTHSVNTNFDQIIVKVNERRNKVLSLIKDLQEKEANVLKSIKQVENMKSLVQEQMVNELHQKTISEWNEKLSALRIEASTYTDYMFVCNEKELDRTLSTLGSIELKPKQYLDKGVPKLAFKNLPDNPIHTPARFSCDEQFDLIAVTDFDGKQVFLFTMSGDFIKSFGRDFFQQPYAIKILGYKELMVSDLHHQVICKVEYSLVGDLVPKIVQALTQAISITSLEHDKDTDLVYATSSVDHCITILTRECKLVSQILRDTLVFPQYLVIGKKELYVMDWKNPSLHVFSKPDHELVRSILPFGIGLELERGKIFSLDQDGNFIIGNCLGPNNMIQVYSPSGQLTHSFSKMGSSLGDVIFPTGIHVTRKNDIVVLSQNSNYPIQIF